MKDPLDNNINSIYFTEPLCAYEAKTFKNQRPHTNVNKMIKPTNMTFSSGLSTQLW